jgi:hypothetical protein
MRWQARCRADAERTARTGWVVIRSASRSSFLFEHDLFGKPDSTFPDHALAVMHRIASEQYARFRTRRTANRFSASARSSLREVFGRMRCESAAAL